MSISAGPESIVRFATAGSVDDGKSTFIGRLLLDTESLSLDHLASVESHPDKPARSTLAMLTDGLKAEREQGITIDVAYRYFSTAKRRFILADSPGHEQYTRNMATAASLAQVVTLLVDAKLGISEQTRRHAVIASLLGVPRLLVAVNKMDLVEFSENRFTELVEEFTKFAAKLNIHDIRFTPICATDGDNIARKSDRIPWYHGESVLEYLENLFIAADENLVDVRFPIQCALPLPEGSRAYAGSLVSGRLKAGDEIICLPRGQKTKIRKILSAVQGGNEISATGPDEPVMLLLEDEIDASRGDMFARPMNLPHQSKKTDLMVLWFAEEPLLEGRELILRQGCREVKVEISKLQYGLNISTLKRFSTSELTQNDIARCSISAFQPLLFDSHERNRTTGTCVFIDPLQGGTVGAGLFLDRETVQQRDEPTTETKNVLHEESSSISIQDRQSRTGTPSKTLWLTGLSGSGKSSLAREFERQLFAEGHMVTWLDGDTLRHGLCSDLDFSRGARRENIRRVAHVAKLFNERGFAVICSYISPFAEDRAMAREIIGPESFLEVYVEAPLEVCEKRDPHGLYRRARAGELPGFTGIDAPYDAPTDPAAVIHTGVESLALGIQRLNKLLFSKLR